MGAANLGCFPHYQSFSASYITEWLKAIERDYSHPSIVGWCPLNETWEPIMEEMSQLDDITRGMFLATKAMDLTRPVLEHQAIPIGFMRPMFMTATTTLRIQKSLQNITHMLVRGIHTRMSGG